MKEAIGGTWLFGLVIAFVVMFTTFISVSTNYSRCFRIKDDILAAIEHYHGINEDSLSIINDYLVGIGYSSTGECPSDDGDSCWFGYKTSDPSRSVGYGSKANYCISKVLLTEKAYKDAMHQEGVIPNGPIGHPESAYYQVIVFFKLNWPILNSVFNIDISGETSAIYLLRDFDEVKDKCG